MIPSETQIGWQDYLAIVIRRRWFFTVPCSAIVIIALIAGFFMPRIYRSETIILAQEPNIMNPLIQGLAVSTPVSQRLRTLREEILSWSSLSRLVHELKLDQGAKSPIAFEKLIKGLQENISVSMRGGVLVRVAYEHEDPKRAQQIVSTVSTIFLERHLEEQASETGDAIDFIESEMAVYKKNLEDSEQALREFRELYATRMPVAVELNNQIIEMQIALANLLIENTEEHPTVIQVRRHILELKEKRNADIKQFVASSIAKGQDPARFEYLKQAMSDPNAALASTDPKVRIAQEAYQAWVTRLDNPAPAPAPADATGPQVQVITQTESGTQMEVLGGGVDAISLGPLQQQELARLTRGNQVNATSYQHLQQRLERAKISQRLGDSDEGLKFKILEPARLPLRPIKPNLWKIFFFGLLFGSFVGIGVAFVAEYLDQSFQTAEDLQAALELPVIGSISTIVTEADLEARNRRRQGWVSWKVNLGRFKTYVVNPIWARVDQALLRWGL